MINMGYKCQYCGEKFEGNRRGKRQGFNHEKKCHEEHQKQCQHDWDEIYLDYDATMVRECKNCGKTQKKTYYYYVLKYKEKIWNEVELEIRED